MSKNKELTFGQPLFNCNGEYVGRFIKREHGGVIVYLDAITNDVKFISESYATLTSKSDIEPKFKAGDRLMIVKGENMGMLGKIISHRAGQYITYIAEIGHTVTYTEDYFASDEELEEDKEEVKSEEDFGKKMMRVLSDIESDIESAGYSSESPYMAIYTVLKQIRERMIDENWGESNI